MPLGLHAVKARTFALRSLTAMQDCLMGVQSNSTATRSSVQSNVRAFSLGVCACVVIVVGAKSA